MLSMAMKWNSHIEEEWKKNPLEMANDCRFSFGQCWIDWGARRKKEESERESILLVNRLMHENH